MLCLPLSSVAAATAPSYLKLEIALEIHTYSILLKVVNSVAKRKLYRDFQPRQMRREIHKEIERY